LIVRYAVTLLGACWQAHSHIHRARDNSLSAEAEFREAATDTSQSNRAKVTQ